MKRDPFKEYKINLIQGLFEYVVGTNRLLYPIHLTLGSDIWRSERNYRMFGAFVFIHVIKVEFRLAY